MNLPFTISDKDWKDLKPKETERLGRRQDLDPEQQTMLEVFRILDLRMEWACGQIVLMRNLLVIVASVVGGIVIKLVESYLTK